MFVNGFCSGSDAITRLGVGTPLGAVTALLTAGSVLRACVSGGLAGVPPATLLAPTDLSGALPGACSSVARSRGLKEAATGVLRPLAVGCGFAGSLSLFRT